MAAEKDIDKVVQQQFFAAPAKDRQPRVLVEVGAARPDFLSISASFRELGWTVIAIEPNPLFCEQHRKLGHDIHQYACSDRDADNVDFFVVNSNHAAYLGGNVSFESFSSLGIHDKFAAELQSTNVNTTTETIQVNVRTLNTILREHHPELATIDLLAVDVEGWELSVIRGLDLTRYQPKVILLENLFNSRNYRRTMRRLGYVRWKRLKPNEIYLRRDLQPSLLRTLRTFFTRP